ncbi:MAG: DUF5591 domain-containing protein [Candidatus Helarchaeota archaeon]
MGLFQSISDIYCEKVENFFQKILNEYSRYRKKKILILFQCSKTKPYSKSNSHRFFRKAVKLGTGFDPVNDYNKCPVSVVVISSLIGPVPYEFEDEMIAKNYQISINRIPNYQYQEIKEILIERVLKFLKKYGNYFKIIYALVKNNYLDIVETVNKRYKHKNIEILPKNQSLHIIREAWVELKDELNSINF